VNGIGARDPAEIWSNGDAPFLPFGAELRKLALGDLLELPARELLGAFERNAAFVMLVKTPWRLR